MWYAKWIFSLYVSLRFSFLFILTYVILLFNSDDLVRTFSAWPKFICLFAIDHRNPSVYNIPLRFKVRVCNLCHESAFYMYIIRTIMKTLPLNWNWFFNLVYNQNLQTKGKSQIWMTSSYENKVKSKKRQSVNLKILEREFDITHVFQCQCLHILLFVLIRIRPSAGGSTATLAIPRENFKPQNRTEYSSSNAISQFWADIRFRFNPQINLRLILRLKFWHKAPHAPRNCDVINFVRKDVHVKSCNCINFNFCWQKLSLSLVF